MPQRPLTPSERQQATAPARWVEGLYERWIDPVEVAFAALEAQIELEKASRRRRGGQPRPVKTPPPQ